MVDLTPGALVVIDAHTLVRRWRSEEEHYTPGYQNGMIIALSHVMMETGTDDELVGTYLVLFSNNMRIYYVPASCLLDPDHLTNPGRLFGRLRG